MGNALAPRTTERVTQDLWELREKYRKLFEDMTSEKDGSKKIKLMNELSAINKLLDDIQD